MLRTRWWWSAPVVALVLVLALEPASGSATPTAVLAQHRIVVLQKDCADDKYLSVEVDAHRHLLYVPQFDGTVDVVSSRTGRVRKVHVLRRPGSALNDRVVMGGVIAHASGLEYIFATHRVSVLHGTTVRKAFRFGAQVARVDQRDGDVYLVDRDRLRVVHGTTVVASYAVDQSARHDDTQLVENPISRVVALVNLTSPTIYLFRGAHLVQRISLPSDPTTISTDPRRNATYLTLRTGQLDEILGTKVRRIGHVTRNLDESQSLVEPITGDLYLYLEVHKGDIRSSELRVLSNGTVHAIPLPPGADGELNVDPHRGLVYLGNTVLRGDAIIGTVPVTGHANIPIYDPLGDVMILLAALVPVVTVAVGATRVQTLRLPGGLEGATVDPGSGQLDILTGQVLTDNGTITGSCELEGLTPLLAPNPAGTPAG